MKYEFDFDKNGTLDYIEAYCGNGSDATCEMSFILNEANQFEFSLPTDIRLLDLNGKIYIVNGVSIDKAGKVTIKGYTVHQVMPAEARQICGNDTNRLSFERRATLWI